MTEDSIEKGYFTFHLGEEEVLEYSKGGDFLTTETIEFRTPGMDEFKEASKLSQLVMGAVMDAGNRSDRPEEEGPEIDAEAVKVILFVSQDITFVDVAVQFNLLAVKVGITDGEEKLTTNLIKKLKQETYTRMVCEYIANFILPSLMPELREGKIS